MKSFKASNSRVLQLLLLTTLATSTTAMAAETSSTDSAQPVSKPYIPSTTQDTQLEIEHLSNELATLQKEHQQKIDEMTSRLEILSKQQIEQAKKEEQALPEEVKATDTTVTTAKSEQKKPQDTVETTKQDDKTVQDDESVKETVANKETDKKTAASQTDETTKTNNASTAATQNVTDANAAQPKTGLGANEVVIDAAYMEKYDMSIAPTVEHTTKPLSQEEVNNKVGQINNQTIKELRNNSANKPTSNANDTVITDKITEIETAETEDNIKQTASVEVVKVETPKETQPTTDLQTEVKPKPKVEPEQTISKPKPEQTDKKDGNNNITPKVADNTSTETPIKANEISADNPNVEQTSTSSSQSTSTADVTTADLYEPPAKPFIPANTPAPVISTTSDVSAESSDNSVSSQPTVQVDAKADPSELYLKALQAFSVSRTDEAIALLNTYIKNYPTHSLISKAHFWLGEAHLQKEPANYAAARFEFLEVINRYADDPNNDKKSRALYRLSQLSKINNYDDELKGYVSILQSQYPEAEETKLAIKLLEQTKTAN